MALIFSNTVKNLFSGSILRTLGNSDQTTGGPYTLGMTIYGGVAPTAAAVAASWATYNSTQPDFLVHFTNAQWYQPAYGTLLDISSLPAAVTPVNNGTATWGIIWAGQPSGPQLASTTLPFTRFLVVSVSDSTGDGVIRFTSTALTIAGGPITVFDGSMATTGV